VLGSEPKTPDEVMNMRGTGESLIPNAWDALGMSLMCFGVSYSILHLIKWIWLG